MYYPYYGKFTHVSEGLASLFLGNGRAGAAAQDPDVLSGYFGQMWGGRRPRALRLQSSISVSDKLCVPVAVCECVAVSVTLCV